MTQTNANLDAIRQEHEPFLTQLEALAVQAIASSDWTPVLEHLNQIMAWQDAKLHEAQKAKVNADELETPSVDDLHNPSAGDLYNPSADFTPTTPHES